jgi:hypothetical protein
MKPDDIDKFTDVLSGDKRAVLLQQLQSIHQEIMNFIEVQLQQMETIRAEIVRMRAEELELLPPEGQAENPATRETRLRLVKAEGDLGKEERGMQMQVLHETKDLHKEEREVEKELLTTKQRDQRLRDFG